MCAQLMSQVYRSLRNSNLRNVVSLFSRTLPQNNGEPKCSYSIFHRCILNYSENYGKNVNTIVSFRSYAKGKDRKKEKGKSKVEINENQIGELVNVNDLKSQMEKAIIQLEDDFVKHLSLRSTTGAIESIPVTYDGKEHTLQELAQIIRKNPKTIVVNFSSFPQVIPDALKAISKSGMNLNPQQDGTTLFIPIPKVTKEHREQLSKNAKQLFVKSKDNIRVVQQKYIKQLKRKDKVSEDLIRSVEQQIIAIGDHFITEAENLLNRKQNELLGDK
ncbi:ribosome-recycling factor, mitochondrial [Sitophilus oryzae]|uniref:Ribosome-recycling factor, mitochondrial n=1 Tax=Sitophilus oryzae TaxID=7048 RepID=A0A6J2XZP1_SITOR|nr:ribosome-recycling factor, mitochondrial [Sitophilus oryzae]